MGEQRNQLPLIRIEPYEGFYPLSDGDPKGSASGSWRTHTQGYSTEGGHNQLQ